MKNIIYGLGYIFWNNLECLSSILKDTVALCDADESKFERLAPLNLPMITPDQMPSTISGISGNYMIYIFTVYFYKEVFDMLTQKLKIPPKNIAPLVIPATPRSWELLMLKRNFYMGGPPLPIRAGALESAVLLPDRADALNYMPKNGMAAEVGVAYGDFSRKIIDSTNPKKFYAIDFFSQNDPFSGFWGIDDFRKDNMPHQQWYENRFKTEIESGMMETRQGMSWDCISKFPDDYFDYVYLDAAHDYNSVKKDIDALKSKVKDGGYIQFNDYCIGPALSIPYGVINAVNEFVNSGLCKIKYFCLNNEPKYIGFPDIVVQLQKILTLL
jgi:hypothetical protein